MKFTTAGGPQTAVILQNCTSSLSTHSEAERPPIENWQLHARPSRRQASRHALLASLSLSNASSLARGSTRGGGFGAVGAVLGSVTGFNLLFHRDAGLRKTFNSIDLDGKGHITEKDLEAFANRNGLPGSYAQHFVSAVLSSHNGSTQTSAQPTGAGKLRGGGAAEDVDHSEDVELTFALFKNFVRSREDALRRAFNMFDQDGDGRISLGDLDATLSRVAVCCPKTRCIYRCRSHMAERLHSKVATDHGSLGFSEFRDFFLLLPQQDMLVEYWVAAGAAPELSDKLSVAGRTGDEGGAKGSPWGHLLAGAIAGATSRTATAPLETLRLAAMAGQLQSRSLAQAASDIVSSQGWRGLYRGNALNVLRSAPQKALDFFAFDAFKRLLGDDTHAKTFLAAGLAGCTSWVALYPLEVVRSRVTVAAAMLPSVGSSGSHVHSRSGAGRTELESRPNSFPSALKPPAARFATASSSSRVFPGSGTGFGPGSASGGPSPTGSGLRGRSVSSTGIAALPGAGTGGSAASGNASPGASLTAAASALRVATSRLWSRLLGGNSRKSRASRSCSTVAASPAATPTAALAAELANDCTAGSFSMASAGAVAAGASMAAVNGGSSGAGGEDPAEVLLPPSPFSSLRVQEACAPALAAACAAAAAAGTVGNKTSVATTMSAPASALGTASSGVACKSPQRRALDQPLASAPAAVMSPVTSQAAAAAEASGALPVVTPISRRDAALASEALFVASHIDEVLAAALSEAEGVPPTSAASLVASVERTSVFVERSSSGVCAGSNSGRSSPVRGPAAGTAISRSLSGQEQALLCAQPLFARAAAAARSLEHPRLRDAVQEAVRRYLNPRRGSVRDALVAVVDVAAEGEGRLHDAAYAAAADVAAVAATAAARCRS